MPDKPALVSAIVDRRFLDEAGDTTFFGRGRIPNVGQPGVSHCFAIGMVKIAEDHDIARQRVRELQMQVAGDRYLNSIPSIAKKISGNGFFFHATDDPPEVRERFYRFIDGLNCSGEVVVARKIPTMFAKNHKSNEAYFYADVLSHLLKNKLQKDHDLQLTIAERGNSTRNTNLQNALAIAASRRSRRDPLKALPARITFDVQNHHTEPLLNVADYMCWAVQRVFERGDTRYYDFLGEKIKLVVDIYDGAAYANSGNYYRLGHRLISANKISPPSP